MISWWISDFLNAKHLYLSPELKKREPYKEVKMEICMNEKTRKNQRCKTVSQFNQQL